MPRNVSRRAILAGAGAVAVNLTSAAAVPASPGPDTAIMEAFGRWLAIELEMASPAAADLPDDDFNALCARGDTTAREIVAMPARSVEGFAIQAWIVFSVLHGAARTHRLEIAYPEAGKSFEADALRPLYEHARRMTAGLRGQSVEAVNA